MMVFSANLSLFGPLGLYWLAVVLAAIGWVSSFTTKKLFKWFLMITVAWFASIYQVAWIDDVRLVYNGSKFTGEGILRRGEKIQQDIVDKVSGSDEIQADGSELEL